MSPIAVRWPVQLDRSIAAKAALALSVLIGGLFVFTAYLAYHDARDESISRSLARLDVYNQEVVGQQEDRFRRLTAAHQHATELLLAELRSGGDTERRQAFEAMMPKNADGTRRTVSALFDGTRSPFGYVRGIGGFVGEEPDSERKSLLSAAIGVVHAVGEGTRPDLKSLSFFTPDNTLVMFAPDRPDKLLYYRRDAGPELDFRESEFVTVTLPKHNPARVTRCTSLQPILYDKSGRTWTTGCHTPIDIDGVHVGAWGNSLLLDDILATSRFENYPSTAVILVSAEGRLIRHPVFTKQGAAATERYLDLTSSNEPQLQALWKVLRQHDSGHFTGFSPELDGYVSIRRIATAGWYAVTVQSTEYVEAPARRSLGRVLVTALVCLVLQAVLLFVFLRRKVERPLRALIREAKQITARVGRRASDHVEQERKDEVGALTAHFRTMSQEVLRAQTMLENRVAERTLQLEQANGELQRLVECDPLTGLYNRRKMLQLLDEAVAGAEAGNQFSLVIFDVDHFKRINDTHGHVIGDRVLRAIAGHIVSALRPDDAIARIGGEEFLILLPGTTASDAYEVSERVRGTLASLEVPTDDRKAVRFTVSLGLAEYAPHDWPEAIYQRADEALYAAKRSGRNQTHLATSARACELPLRV